MLVERITSRQNPLVKRFRRVRIGGEHHLVFIEGVRLVEEAVRADAHFESVAFSPQLQSNERGRELLAALEKVPCRGAMVTQQVMEAIADTESPQGVAAIITRPHFDLEHLFELQPDLIVITDGLQDPGNLGTIIRTAKAAGAAGVITTTNTVDPMNPKSVRSSMGAALGLAIVAYANLAKALELCHRNNIKVIAARPAQRGPTNADQAVRCYTEVDLSGPIALVVGKEAAGISETATASADEFVYLPMAEGIESLNVAAATAVLLYETARQRGFKFGEQEGA